MLKIVSPYSKTEKIMT